MEAVHVCAMAASAALPSVAHGTKCNPVDVRQQLSRPAGVRRQIALKGSSLVALSLSARRHFPGHQQKRQSLSCRASAGLGGRPGVLTPELKNALDGVVSSNKIVLFMKGDRNFPQCGFSNTVVQVLNTFNVPYETVDVLSNNQLREALKEYSAWPTFPQVYIDGEFFGGCDIVIESFQSGELKETLERVLNS